MKTEDEIYETATLEAFNICCAWLSNNGHSAAATGLAAFLNEPATQEPAPILLGGMPKLDRATAQSFGYTGNMCQCGSMQMVRNGTCEKCEACGSTTGCS